VWGLEGSWRCGQIDLSLAALQVSGTPDKPIPIRSIVVLGPALLTLRALRTSILVSKALLRHYRPFRLYISNQWN
jgi:hypothetical protein